jgi:hypothetical protein
VAAIFCFGAPHCLDKTLGYNAIVGPSYNARDATVVWGPLDIRSSYHEAPEADVRCLNQLWLSKI